MVSPTLTRLADAMARRRSVVGLCATCRAAVYGDERHVRLDGVLVHGRCVAYRRRAPTSG